MNRVVKWLLLVFGAFLLVAVLGISLLWYNDIGPGLTARRTAHILIHDDYFGGRATSRAIHFGDAVLPLIAGESKNFESLNWINAFRVAEVLGAINTKRATLIAHSLFDRSEHLQHLVGAAALAQKGMLDSRGIDDLVATVNGPDRSEAELAIIALGKAGAMRAAPILIEVLREGPGDYWRQAEACDAIARIRYTAAIPVLKSCLRSKDFAPIPNAFRSLITLGDSEAVPLAIARVGPELEGYNSGDVVMELEKVTGQHFGYTRQLWTDWWSSAKPSWSIPSAFKKRFDEQPPVY
jgi:hypothetical protein